MSSSRKGARIAIAGVFTALVALVPAGSASAVTLNGEWAPFTRCPVDDPAMLAADGATTADLCLASHSPNGSIKLGNSTATTGNSDLQLGLLSTPSTSATEVVSPPGGGIVADPVDIPGGLLGLMCPDTVPVPVVTNICRKVIEDNNLNRVTATVEPAGNPSDFDVVAGTGVGQPILTLPVKVRLDNPLLATGCTIGTDSDPIVLKPKNLSAPTVAGTGFDGDGTENPGVGALIRFDVTGTAQGDDSFAVPGARGCGGGGLVDAAINLKTGLPSPSGNNNLVLNDASTSIAGLTAPSDFAPNAGQQMSAFWHSAILP